MSQIRISETSLRVLNFAKTALGTKDGKVKRVSYNDVIVMLLRTQSASEIIKDGYMSLGLPEDTAQQLVAREIENLTLKTTKAAQNDNKKETSKNN